MSHFVLNNVKTLAERFLQTAAKYPDRPGLHPGWRPGFNQPDKIYTYRELEHAALKVAEGILKSHQGQFVPVIADKSFACYTSILGILLAGKAYLPLNPRFPEERNRYMMEKAGTGTPSLLTCADNPAYLLFTSGTTGKPKGVAVSNGNVGIYLDFMLRTFDFSPQDRFTQNFDLTFDLSVHDLFLCWSVGACLCVPDDNSSFRMARFVHQHKPSVWFSVPSVVSLLDRMRLLKQNAFPSVRMSFFCGEALLTKQVEAWSQAAPDSKIINLYGPTEATIAISRYEIPAVKKHIKQEMGIVSIGKVFDGNEYSLMASSQDASGIEHGELCLSGPQVVAGYFENPEADDQYFFTDDSGKNWYKTGDLVKVDKDGDLFFLGRSDSEVKIFGYRVNLREIENVLTGYEPVSHAVVIFNQQENTQDVLLAFIQHRLKNISEPELDELCRKLLPWYMVPQKYIFVEEIPLNENGKVDRSALLKIYHESQ